MSEPDPEILDEYLRRLQIGDQEGRAQLLIENPDLSEFARCLEDLEELAPRSRGPAGNDETIVPREGSSISTPQQLAGQVFGKYELDREIGRGGMGVVFKAQQTDLRRFVAVKMILSGHLASNDEVRRFQAEARAAGNLKHSGIVAVHEVGQINGQHFLAMDYVEGISLAKKLERAALDNETAAKFLRQLADAVAHLHQHGVIHRDIKPSNVLIDPDQGPQLTDFGLAKLFDEDDATRTGMIIGTAGYMSPEQAAGRSRHVDARSDLYSLGAIFYEMLTGQAPFSSENPLETIVKVLENEPPLPRQINRGISRELEQICLKCLEKDPARRYGSAEELVADLDRYLKGEPIVARKSKWHRPLIRWARREPALVSRLTAFVSSAIVMEVAFAIANVSKTYHRTLLLLLIGWSLTAIVFHRLSKLAKTARRQTVVNYVWLAADAIWLTVILYEVREPVGPLLVGYPLLIAASGLFSRVRLVFFMTGVAIAAFGVLCFLRSDLGPPHYPMIFITGLAIVGLTCAYQAHRVRVLARYAER